MSQIAEWFAPSLLRTSLTLIVAALFVATCVKWLRLRSPAGEQWAWLLVLVQGVMFVSLTVPVPSEWFPELRAPTPPTQQIDLPAQPVQLPVPLKLDVPERPFDRRSPPIEVFVETESPIDAAEVAVAPTVAQPTLRDRLPSWTMLLCIVWLTGVAAIIVVGLLRYSAFVRHLRSGRPAPSDWTDEWSRMCAAAGVSSAIPLVVTRNVGPALCRLPAGYQLVVPEQIWETLSNVERCAIYRHELEHYRRGDLWWMLGVRLLASVHWFNPFAWWAARKYEAQSEFACDAAAAGDDPARFSELLVQLASGRTRRIVGVQSVAAGSVYERVQRLLRGAEQGTWWRAAVPVAIAGVTVVVAGVRLEAVADSTPTTSAEPAELAVLPSAPVEKPELATQLAAADAPTEEAAATSSEPAVAPPTDVAADEIAGVVIDSDGKPVPDALIDVWHWVPGNETRTDEHGVFRLAGIDPTESVEVRVTKDGYTPAYFPERTVGARGWIVLLTDTTYIEGTIIGADDQPAVEAEIRATFGPVEVDGGVISEVLTLGKTGLDGKYRLYLKPDTYDIQIAAPGQGVKRLTGVVVASDEATPLSVTLERGVRFEARVIDSESGEPVEGFILWQWRPPYLFARSGVDGVIAFDDLVPGTISLDCGGGEPIDYKGMKLYQHGPFGRWWSEQAAQEWERKQIDDPKTGWQRNFDGLSFDLKPGMDPVEIVVERGVAVSGRVTDPDGNPVAGATVAPAKTGSGNSLTGDTRYSEKTKEDGTYSVVLPASNDTQYNLTVHDGEYSEWRTWANGVREPMQTKPGQVIQNYDLQLTRPAIIRGQVTFAGKPAANREVRTHAFDKLENRYYDPTTKTDKDGNFELKFVRAGKHYLQVEPFYLSAEQAPKGSREIEVEAGQVLEGQDLIAAPLHNQPSPSLAGLKFQARIVDSDGNPVSGVSAGIGLFGGAPHYLASLHEHYPWLVRSFNPAALPESNAEGMLDLDTVELMHSRQNVAWIYAVDPAGGRAGTALLNLDEYATADPSAGPQIIEVAVEPVKETVLNVSFNAILPQALAENERRIIVNITRDGMPLQRVLADGQEISLLLPSGEYQAATTEWIAQRVQSTWKVASGEPTRVDIELQPSKLGSLIGQPAPEFSQLKPGEAANPTLAELKGQLVVLDFWGHWCGPCVQSMPNLMQLHGEFKDRGVSIIGVHDDSVASYGELQTIMERLQNEHWNGQPIPFAVVLDGGGETAVEGTEFKVNGATTASYGILSWPTTLVIDRSGRIVGQMAVHDLDAARKRLNELLEQPAP